MECAIPIRSSNHFIVNPLSHFYPQFQNHWARKISEKSFGIWVRTRVGLRRDLGREPTTDEINEAKNNGVYNKMSSDVIKEAFACGQEVSHEQGDYLLQSSDH